MSDDLKRIIEHARRFVEFCDGMEEAGMVTYALRGRRLARETIQLADELKTVRPLQATLTSWRSSLLICGNGSCRRLVVTAGDEVEAARAAFAEGDANGTDH